jgi:hypothetical protein
LLQSDTHDRSHDVYDSEGRVQPMYHGRGIEEIGVSGAC